MTASFNRRTFTHGSADRRSADRHSANSQALHHQDIGYLLTAYADGQLAPEGVMWVEEQLDRTPDLRAKLKEIRYLQAGLRSAFAGGAPAFALDLPRRDALLASAANPSRKRLRFHAPLWIGLAASVMAMVYAGMQWFGSSVTPETAVELPPMRAYSINSPSGVAAGESPTEHEKPQGSRGRNTIYLGSSKTKSDGSQGYTVTESDRDQSRGNNVSVNEQLKVALPTSSPIESRKENNGLFRAHEELHKSLTPQNRQEVYPTGGAPSEPRKPQESVAAKPAVVVPSSPPSSPPFEQEKDAQILDRPVISSFNGQQAKAKALSGVSAGKTEFFESDITIWNGQIRHDISAADLAQSGADGYVRLNETLAYNGAYTGKISREPVTAQGEFVGSTESHEGEVARGREEAIANVETGSTGAFMANGAGDRSTGMLGNRTGGAKRRALAQYNQDAEDLPKTKPVGTIVGGEGDGKSATVAVDINNADTAPVGGLVRITRNDLGVVEGHITALDDNGKATIAVDPATWNVHGAKIMSGDVVQAIISSADPNHEINAWRSVPIQVGDQEAQKQVQLGILKDRYPKIYTEIGDEKSSVVSTQGDVGAVLKPAVALSSLLTASAVANPQKSFATLRSPMTFDGKLGLAQCLRLIGGDHIGYSISPGANEFLGRQVQLNMRDEATSRGVLRAVRGAGLQAQFSGGLVKLDVAQRPLNPTDTQSFDLPTFKELFGTAPMQNIAVDPVQTVAIDADTASYSYAKARIAAGQEIDPTTIKPEHFINAMPMDYPPAQGPEAFSLYAEAAPSPFARAHTAWGPRTALVSIGAVAKPARADERRPLALTLAVDCSGSMAQPGALARVKLGLQTMTRHLRADDRVAIVAFGDQARVVLPSTPGNDQRALLAALDGLTTGGATNASEGLTLAYQMAAETAASGVESRVLLATDGGTVARADELLHRVTAFKDRGITLVVVGCGETYHAGPLQELATKGDGQHYFIGSDDEAEKLFSTTLLPDHIAVLAKDAKLQVTWNLQRVSHARLIGYDQRRLATKDFRNNAVDAGELSQDTQVTALFEVLLVDGGSGQLGTAAVRYHDTRRQQVRELACPLPGSILASQPSDRLRLLACAAATAEWLQRGWWSNVHLITPAEIATQLGRCPQPIAAELKAMIR